MEEFIVLDEDLEELKRAVALGTPLPKVKRPAVKHLPGQHDQRSHGNWSRPGLVWEDYRIGEEEGGTYTQAALFAESELPPADKPPALLEPEEFGEVHVSFNGDPYMARSDEHGFYMPEIIDKLETLYVTPGHTITIEIDDWSDGDEVSVIIRGDITKLEEREGDLVWDDETRTYKRVQVETEVDVGEFEDQIVQGFSHEHGDTVTVLHAQWLALEERHQDQGLSKILGFNKLALAHSLGLDGMTFEANAGIGRYAWAKYGASFAEPDRAARSSNHFRQWAEFHGYEEPSTGWPKFKTPYDVATYKHPEGHTFTTDRGFNADVEIGLEYELGKAFMLDAHSYSGRGMGYWDAVVWINQP